MIQVNSSTADLKTLAELALYRAQRGLEHSPGPNPESCFHLRAPDGFFQPRTLLERAPAYIYRSFFLLCAPSGYVETVPFPQFQNIPRPTAIPSFCRYLRYLVGLHALTAVIHIDQGFPADFTPESLLNPDPAGESLPSLLITIQTPASALLIKQSYERQPFPYSFRFHETREIEIAPGAVPRPWQMYS